MKYADSYDVLIRYPSPYVMPEDPSDSDLCTQPRSKIRDSVLKHTSKNFKLFYSLKTVLFQLYPRKVIFIPQPSQTVINTV